MVVNEVNSDYGSLFQEKKYKELLTFAREQQPEQVRVFALQIGQLRYITGELTRLSQQRVQLLLGAPATEEIEESKDGGQEDIVATFRQLAGNSLVLTHTQELYTAYQRAREQEAQLKATAAAQAEDPEKAKKKK
jgi:hypothetical protein